MVGKAEYLVARQNLFNLAQDHKSELQEQLAAAPTDLVALQQSRTVLGKYHSEAEKATLIGMESVGMRAAQHYNSVLNLGLEDTELKALTGQLISEQLDTPYHGLSLQNRFRMNRVQADARLEKASRVGVRLSTRKENLTRHFLEPYPFGAQINYDTRILLAQAVLLEHQVAKNLAKKAGAELAIWTLSERHSQKDICDTLAEQVLPEVREFISQNGLNLAPEGVHFIDSIPSPPHPNCQCTLRFFHKKEITKSVTPRSFGAIRALWGVLKQKLGL